MLSIFLMNTKGWKNLGLLVLRIGLGLTFVIIHGGPKLFGGVEAWQDVGSAMTLIFGIETGLVYFGFLAAISEFIGGICLMLGLFFRPALVFLTGTMVVATLKHVQAGEAFSYPLEMAIVFGSLFIIGPGSIALDHILSGVFKSKS